MSKLLDDPRLPLPPADATTYERELSRRLNFLLRNISVQVNQLSESRISGNYNAHSGTPSTVILADGDIIRDKYPSETGTVGAKYVRLGWIAIADGTASASSIVELRAPTGR